MSRQSKDRQATGVEADGRAPRRLERPVVLGAGPVGRGVVEQLRRRGLQPTVVTRSGAHVAGAASVAADIGDEGLLAATMAGADVVFQCAQPPYHLWASRFPELQRSVIRACQGSDAVLVAAENLYGYGVPEVAITEEQPLVPNTGKGRLRVAMWQELSEIHQSGRLRTVAVRASDFFGPDVVDSAFGLRFFGRLAAGKRAQVLGDPSSRHAVTFVPDFADALIRVAERPWLWGRAWLAPTPPARRQQEIVEIAARHLAVEPGMRSVGSRTLRLVGLFDRNAREVSEMLGQFTTDFQVDSSRSERELGLTPTDIDQAIGVTVDGYRKTTPQSNPTRNSTAMNNDIRQGTARKQR